MGTNYFGDVLLSFFEVSKRTLDHGDVEVKLDASRSGAGAFGALATVAILEVQPVINRMAGDHHG